MAHPRQGKQTADRRIDCRGGVGPGPLLEMTKAIREMKRGEVLEILVDDPGIRDDIRYWAGNAGHEYMGEEKADGYGRLFIRRMH